MNDCANKDNSNKATLSFLDKEFLNSDAGRSIRILSEYQLPEHYIKDLNIHNCITVFGSARQLNETAKQKYPRIAAAYKECEDIVSNLMD